MRWEGTGSNVEVSFMKGKKEVAKATAKLVNLEQASQYDSSVLDHASGKTTVSEVRFAGKKYALALSGSEMSANTNK